MSLATVIAVLMAMIQRHMSGVIVSAAFYKAHAKKEGESTDGHYLVHMLVVHIRIRSHYAEDAACIYCSCCGQNLYSCSSGSGALALCSSRTLGRYTGVAVP